MSLRGAVNPSGDIKGQVTSSAAPETKKGSFHPSTNSFILGLSLSRTGVQRKRQPNKSLEYFFITYASSITHKFLLPSQWTFSTYY